MESLEGYSSLLSTKDFFKFFFSFFLLFLPHNPQCLIHSEIHCRCKIKWFWVDEKGFINCHLERILKAISISEVFISSLDIYAEDSLSGLYFSGWWVMGPPATASWRTVTPRRAQWWWWWWRELLALGYHSRGLEKCFLGMREKSFARRRALLARLS